MDVMAQQLGHVVVVGAGMVGLSTAWHLQEYGVQVTVVDPRELPGYAAPDADQPRLG